MKFLSDKFPNRSCFFDWSLECAAMEWNGKACTLGEKKSFHALPGYRCGYRGATLRFSQRNDPWNALLGVFDSERDWLLLVKIHEEAPDSKISAFTNLLSFLFPVAPFIHYSSGGNILHSFSKFYVPVRSPTCPKRRWSINLLKRQVYKEEMHFLQHLSCFYK